MTPIKWRIERKIKLILENKKKKKKKHEVGVFVRKIEFP